MKICFKVSSQDFSLANIDQRKEFEEDEKDEEHFKWLFKDSEEATWWAWLRWVYLYLDIIWIYELCQSDEKVSQNHQLTFFVSRTESWMKSEWNSNN